MLRSVVICRMSNEMRGKECRWSERDGGNEMVV